MGIYDAAFELGYDPEYLRFLSRLRVVRADKVDGAWIIPMDEIERLRGVNGPLIRRTREAMCAAPDCGKVFVSDCRAGQRYCSKTCQRRTYMRAWRAAA